MISKNDIYNKCLTIIDQKIQDASDALEMAREALENEEKNPTGDAFESGRAMMQIEVEKHSTHLEEAIKVRHTLRELKAKKSEAVNIGSLVITDSNIFYISVPLGKVCSDTETCFAISPSSPIAAKFMKKNVGDMVEFNGKKYKIKRIE